MRANFEHNGHLESQRLADLQNKTAELERELSDARLSLERELAQFAYGREAGPDETEEIDSYTAESADPEWDVDSISPRYRAAESPHGHDDADSAPHAHSAHGRTEVLVNHGRKSAYYGRLSRGRKTAIGTALIAILVTTLTIVLSSGGASWPSTVAIVQSEAAKACQNPDVKSEPGQINFACAKDTRQILWVFALLTSGDNPNFIDGKTGRLGLEPITPTQGGEVAWSLNLHYPYSPFNPTDSLEVAARAINNIIGGATLVGANGNVVVQSGLESDPANCVRYTGSAAISARKGFPDLCAEPVSTPAGEAALVADVYRKWIVGAAPKAAQDAAELFENASNPGDPQVQTILKHLPGSKHSA
jgi:hypothetical protein